MYRIVSRIVRVSSMCVCAYCSCVCVCSIRVINKLKVTL